MANPLSITLTTQIVWLLVLAVPVACVAWTVTHEELFAEFRAWCVRESRQRRSPIVRKFFYVFTCEYCFSHYVAALAIAVTGFRLLMDGWPGLLISWLALVWVANVYMSLFVRLRLDIKRERVELNVEEQKAADLAGNGPKSEDLGPATSSTARGVSDRSRALGSVRSRT
jgi:hypothetical protein